jgi:hypothetical protein
MMRRRAGGSGSVAKTQQKLIHTPKSFHFWLTRIGGL